MSRQYSIIKTCYLFLPERFNLEIHHSPVLYIYNDYTEEILGVYSFDRKRHILYVRDFYSESRNKYRYISTYELENSGWVVVNKKLKRLLDKLKNSLEELPF